MRDLVAVTGSGGRIFVVGVVLTGVLLALFLLPFLWHVARAVAARDPWLPFDRKPDGGYTFMARHRWFSAFRAPAVSRRGPVGLAVRYVVWLGVIATFVYPFVWCLGVYLDHRQGA
ncbi:hypothetical protein KMZ32_00880 [Phycicoccus sp. MAQZ13P-2]|uniref:hypothetical protein n=1 Tax=Phycicoccus mangrovi TaxID=2840470 RepID=UPI001BFFEA78|nr:hypothetical protein [Phycicoccus mangrovi]MBT9254245.1 hypothetical protein [Phycicoccus mangrovi]MBT9272623.1 hypothetical protein [Phycicoccus mangrovi]